MSVQSVIVRWTLLLGAGLLACSSTRAPATTSPEPKNAPVTPLAEVVAPPRDVVARLHLSPSYKQYVALKGFAIIGSDRVSPYALLEARYIVAHMIGDRPDILAAMAANQVRLAIMAHTEMTTDIPEHSDLLPKEYWNRRARGLGATDVRPAVSAAEENLLELPGDPYAAENILVHEFAHAIHERGMNTVDPTFDARLQAAYEHAMKAGLWKSTYAATNHKEYWAEATQSWFDTNRVNDEAHGLIDTRAMLAPYDPDVAKLLTEVYGDKPWRYLRPSQRTPEERAHLAGFDHDAAGSFVWPASAPAIARDSAPVLPWMKPADAPARSPSSDKVTSIEVRNLRQGDVTLFWRGFDGREKKYATVHPGATHQQTTYAGHVWIVTDASGTIGAFVAASDPGRVEVK